MKETFFFEGFDVLAYETTDSTNEEARRLLRAGKEGSFAVWALRQSAGRGRYGRQWASLEGNLFVSLALKVDKPIQESAQLSFVAAVAVGEVLAGVLGDTHQISYKWPNDVLVDGKKIAGILLESSATAGASVPDNVIVGIGLNIASYPEQTLFPATSICHVADIPLKTDMVRECLQRLLKSFTQWYKLWNDNGIPPIRQEWLSNAWAKGEVIKVDTGNAVFHGVFEGMTETGEMVVTETGGLVRHVTSGEIFFGNE